MVDSVEGLSADDIPDLLPSLPKNQTEGEYTAGRGQGFEKCRCSPFRSHVSLALFLYT